jgi:hypothetical protein
MLRMPARTVLPILMLLSAFLPLAAQDEELPPPVREEGPAVPSRFVTLSLGPTTASGPGLFERALFEPPDAAMLAPGSAWEISMDLAIELGRMAPEDRWRAIRRNLGLAPDAKADFLLWTEVVDDLLAALGALPPDDKNPMTAPGFGLRVAFPGDAPVDESAPDVALAFDPGTRGTPVEESVIAALLKAVTGIEGSVSLVDPAGQPIGGDWLSKFPDLTVHLRDSEGNEKGAARLRDYPFYHFSRLAGVPDLGGDFWLTVSGGEPGLQTADGVPGPYLPVMEPQYAPVRPGLRTRQDITLTLVPAAEAVSPVQEEKLAEEIDFDKSLPDLAAAETSVEDAVRVITGAFPLLGPILATLPSNPGIHFGIVQTKDDGPQLFFSARFKFKAETHDRRPRFVSRGTVRFQVMTLAAAQGLAPAHYVRVTWCGRATGADLSLANRPVSRFPLGLGLGIVPSVSPVMYSAGLSYKVMKGLELYAGAGFRAASDDPEATYARTSFVYGLTLDVQSVVDIIARAVGKEDR